MQLTSLRIEQYRSYDSLDFPANEGLIHVLYGPNGAGKTNILEAIHILSLSRSFLRAEDQELTQWDQEWYRLTAGVQTQADEEYTLEVAYQNAPQRKKVFRHNGVSIPAKQLVGLLPTVTFVPEDLELFTGAPARRRQYLDRILCQVSPSYLQTLSTYQHVLKQRNVLLKTLQQSRGDTSALHVWNEQLAQLGTVLTLARLELLNLWQLSIESEVQQLGEQWDNCTLEYIRKTEATDEQQLCSEFTLQLERNTARDIALASTSIGPHRDDWQLLVEGRKITSFASRGQQRTAIVALLFLETSYLELKRNERPVVLLDDVFSELDDTHQQALQNAMSDTQVFITTAHTPPQWQGALYWQVGNGSVEPFTL